MVKTKIYQEMSVKLKPPEKNCYETENGGVNEGVYFVFGEINYCLAFQTTMEKQ